MPGAVGLYGANPYYALAARRHMIKYGTTSEELSAIAVSTRAWAALNPLAQMRKPITIDDHQATRMIADPRSRSVHSPSLCLRCLLNPTACRNHAVNAAPINWITT